MKKLLYSFILLLFGSFSFGQVNLYEQLLEVNAEWKHHPVAAKSYANELPVEMNDRQAIARHLEAVQGFLLANRPVGLDANKLERRESLLQELTPYYTEDWYPVNDVLPVRRPIFIDRFDHFCAVGYLMKMSGHEDLARRISEEMNYAYVREMDWPEIGEWAAWAGFTPEELAWIQPGYPPTGYFIGTLSQGTNGEVLAIEKTNSGGLLVGGNFTQVDGTIPASYIAEWRPGFAGFDWVDLQSPLQSPVTDILEVGGTYYVAGDFSLHGNPSSVYMYSENWGWMPYGQLLGEVEQLVVYQGTLFAVGLFDSNPPGSNVYGMAGWIGNGWMVMQGGVNGRGRAAEVWNDTLFVGGDFQDGGSHVKAYDGVNFTTIGSTPISAPIYDFEVYGGQLYAAGQFFGTTETDTFGLARWTNGDWENLMWSANFTQHDGDSAFYVLESFTDRLILGGAFNYSPFVGTFSKNMVAFNDDFDSFEGLAIVDEPVHALQETYNAQLYFGGFFISANSTNANHIAVSDFGLVSTPEIERLKLELYPNPTSNSIRFEWPESIKDAEVHVFDMVGHEVMVETLNQGEGLSVATLAAGSYTVQFNTDRSSWSGTFIKE